MGVNPLLNELQSHSAKKPIPSPSLTLRKTRTLSWSEPYLKTLWYLKTLGYLRVVPKSLTVPKNYISIRWTYSDSVENPYLNTLSHVLT